MEKQGRDSPPVDRGSDFAPETPRVSVQQLQDLLPIKLCAGQVNGNGYQQSRGIGGRHDRNHVQGL